MKDMFSFDHISHATLPTRHGDFVAYAFRESDPGRECLEHLALVRGDVQNASDVLVRVHSECLTGDVFGSRRCDCGEQLDLALQRVAEAGRGVVIYVRGHEGRAIGLVNKISAYAQQDEGLDTVEANLAIGQPVDARRYDAAAEILRHLKVKSIRLLSNNPRKASELTSLGVVVSEQLPHETASHAQNHHYLSTKRDRMGHLLDLPPGVVVTDSVPTQPASRDPHDTSA
jgi:GTP cyclohydrolase II